MHKIQILWINVSKKLMGVFKLYLFLNPFFYELGENRCYITVNQGNLSLKLDVKTFGNAGLDGLRFLLLGRGFFILFLFCHRPKVQKLRIIGPISTCGSRKGF